MQGLALARAGAGPFGAFSRVAALEQLPTEPVVEAAPDVREDLALRAAQEQNREQQRDPADQAFADKWPAQAGASQDLSRPDTTRWALVIGINEHLGKVRDNFGSAQDAHDLRQFLLSNGWRDDHIVLITDTDATRDNMLAGMRWLSSKTSKDSVAIFHYSGHSKKWYGEDHDGDGEVTDEGLWPTDDKFIVDSEFVRHMADVRAGRFWINIGACNSAGFNDPGLAKPGRLLTFSSAETEKSYEDPSVENSVWGWYLFDEGFLQGYGDTNGDGVISVEETFNFAKPRAAQRTEGQEYGRQNAVIIDQLDGGFTFEIPKPPPPPEPEKTEDPESEEEPEQGGNRGLLCPVICGQRLPDLQGPTRD